MAIKVKEINANAETSIKVNKNFYMMCKSASFYLYQDMAKSKGENIEEYLKETMTKKYPELDDLQKAFFTIALLLAEMEINFKKDNQFTEKEVLEPGDEGYVPPTED
jgi:uncharacterized protein YktB (UPF0637 family)